MVVVRRLGSGDESLLELLAREDAQFDVDGRSEPRRALGPGATAAYLADPDVLHWVAEDAGTVVGHLYCHVLRRRCGDPLHVMLYEIGVRHGERRRGIGQAMVKTLQSWMHDHGIRHLWTLAGDAGAEQFYAACGLTRDEPQPVQMSCRLN